MKSAENYHDHLDALAILSRAKLATIDEIHTRVQAHTEYWVEVSHLSYGSRTTNDDDGAPDLKLGEVMHAYSVVDGAWNRVFAETFK